MAGEAEARLLIAEGLGAAAGREARFGGGRRGAVNEIRFFEWRGRPLLLRRRLPEVAFAYEPDIAKEAVVAAAWRARGGGAAAVEAAMAAALQRPAPGRLPHGPELLAAGHGARPWSIQQALPGRALGEAPELAAYRRLGALLAELHALPLAACAETFRELGGPPLDPGALFGRDLERALAAAGLQAPLSAALRQAAATDFSGARPALCHNDLHGLNVLRGEAGEPVPIDWDNAVLRPAELDLVKLRHWTALDAGGWLVSEPALYAAFREGYDGAGGPAPDTGRLRACEILWLLRALIFEQRREAAGRPPAPPFPPARHYRARLEVLAEGSMAERLETGAAGAGT
ncbi:Phosphotransferase enzyme family protein [Tistlia consotensis]|uniref:Phosphotransferase enzyme family protein n=1 Tax=Tistlia consotensis USBA 355 TaxID=560819 RepID=A0A1Y6CNE0_9PROT|nr:aminoglycoside phosphotransferase family protein [Tistlia consotensis]SMF78853.1 Phosphotransferase enzyme family protein [Tistlia consotensis USBA 355]SNS14932.1 Phosphotransferase enzyme family protein [Tistlia consotensis]